MTKKILSGKVIRDKSDKTVIVEATLSSGDVINPYTGDAPILTSLDYPILWHDHNQFWRKFFSRVTKKGKQKYNFFSDQTIESASDFRFTDDRVAKTNRQIDRSLRSVVKVNSEQIKLPITDEEKSLQLLARQQ